MKENLNDIENAVRKLQIRQFMDVRLEIIDTSSNYGHKYDLMSDCHKKFINSYVDFEDWLVFLHPDYLFTRSFNSGLANSLDLGDVILINTPRLSLEKLQNVYSNRTSGTLIECFELTSKDVRRTLHPYFIDRFIGKGQFSSWPVELVFDDPKIDRWIVKAGGLHPVAVNSKLLDKKIYELRFDNDLLEKLYRSGVSFYIIEETNNLCIFEISPSNYQVGTTFESKLAIFWIAAIYACWMPESFRRVNLGHTIWFGDESSAKGIRWRLRKLRSEMFTNLLVFLIILIGLFPKQVIKKMKKKIESKLGKQPFQLYGGYSEK